MPSARLAPALDSLAPEASSPEHDTPGVVASSVYANGRRVADISIDDAGDWAHKEGHGFCQLSRQFNRAMTLSRETAQAA